MKYNRIILVSFFLLILALGAVSASEDIQDNSTSTCETDVLADDGDLVEYPEGTGSQNPNVAVNWPSEIKVGEYYPVTFNLPEDMQSNVALFVNNERVDDGQPARNDLPYEVYLDEFGSYNLKFKFYGDAKYAPSVKEKSYVVNDFMFKAEVKEENLTYGQEAHVTVEYPFDATGTIAVGNVKYAITDLSLTAPLQNLQVGSNQIQIAYSGDSKYPARKVNVNVNVAAGLVYSRAMPFNNVAFILNLPANAVGSLEITVDGNNKKASKLTNGKAEIRFDGLALGEHSFKAHYIGSDYNCTTDDVIQFEVTPDITVDSFKTTKDENSVTIRLPAGEAGQLDVNAYRYLQETGGMVVDEISKSFNVVDGSVVNLSTFEYGYYSYDIRYTSKSGYLFSTTVEGYVRDVYSMNITAPDDILTDEGNIPITVSYLTAYGSSIELYVDGIKYDEIECNDSNIMSFSIREGLKSGNHAITVKFPGNERYLPLEKSVNIKSNYLFFDIPDEIVIGEDDEIAVYTVKDATGNLAVYVDGSLFKTQAIKNGFAAVSMNTLQFKTYSIRAAYEKGNHPSLSQTKAVTVSYTFAMSEESVGYGGDGFYEIDLPTGLSKDKLVVKVDNVVYPVISRGNSLGINVSGLGMGSHIISVEHPGEGKYYPLSIQKTISIDGKISIPSQINLGQDKSISLVLPPNPQGKLVLYKYNENYNHYAEVASFGFTKCGNNAIAEIPLSYLSIGENNIKVSYSGDDYNVSDVAVELNVNLDISYSKQVQYGKKLIATVYLPNARGQIDVSVDEQYSGIAVFSNGVAKVQFSNLDVGKHTFELAYYGDYSFTYEGAFVVYPGISVPSSIIDGSKSISLDADSDAVGSICIYENGKKVNEADVEKGGKISLAFLEKGNHKITLVYDSWDEMSCTLGTYTVNVKKASITAKGKSMSYLDGSKYKVQVKDYKGKAVKKGQSVKFYVDGKLFKTVKTNAKGYASVVFTHAPGTHAIKMVYKATAVTKKLTVKQILTLKKVNIKKSAKKLVLTAILKKVKGKYLKDKQIAFKFNGKTYKVKTSSKGVAKVTIPSKILKKLKVGNTVSYQATYMKATVKQSVKVKK